MKKIILLLTTLFLLNGISKAAKKEAAGKNNNAPASDYIAALPASNTATAISMADVMKENQSLKLLLAKALNENENLKHQVDFAQNMYFSTTGLYETELQKQQENNRLQAEFDWTMHAVLENLNQLPPTE